MDEQPAPDVPEQEVPETTSTENYADFLPEKFKKKQKHTRRLLVLFIILLVIAAGGAAYWFLLRPKPKTASPVQSQQAQVQPEVKTVTTKTKHYVSTNFSLEFDYPEDWTVTETQTSTQLTVKSPTVQFKDANNTTVNGQISFVIRNKQQALPEFDKGNAIAARDSEKVAYTKPTQTQRGSTYLSFLRFASSAGSGIDGIYITGDNGYKTDQAIPKVDISKVDPVINMTFTKCDGSCAATSISTSSWDDKTFSDPLKSLLTSLSIQ